MRTLRITFVNGGDKGLELTEKGTLTGQLGVTNQKFDTFIKSHN